MQITTILIQGIVVARVTGELDMHSANEFRQAVDSALETSGTKNILLNLQGVTFIDSSGLGVILGRYKRISVLGGKMLMAHVQPQVVRILELSGLLNIITLSNSESEALTCI